MSPNRLRAHLYLFLLSTLFIPATPSEGQPSGGSSQKDTTAHPQRMPYQYLRFNENYENLSELPDEFSDWFDPIKDIEVTRFLTLQVGAELRARFERETNKFFAPGEQEPDGFLLSRFAMHMDVRLNRAGRLFIEGIHADVFDRDEILFSIHRNRLDLHQFFVDVELGASTLRIGRQEMSFANQRVISASGWGRIRKRFDAVTLLSGNETWRIASWYSRPVLTLTEEADRPERDIHFAGAYLEGRDINFNLYYFYQSDRRLLTNPNGNTGKRNVHTIGGLYFTNQGPFDLYLEVNGQPSGTWATDKIRAWSLGASVGYSILSSRNRPRLGMGLELASGDQNPLDDVVNTYDQLYRQEKDHLGYLVVFGRQNIQAFNVNARIGLIPRKVLMEVFHYWFQLQSGTDAAYNPGARILPGRRNSGGEAGRTLGRELDVVLGWQIDRHHSLLTGYMHYWNGSFIRSTGNARPPANLFLEYKLIF